MKSFLRYSSIFLCVLVLCIAVPLHSHAVDPVSAATMANAMAQAITAYGASQGVSMTFDVVNTDGIGENVKELWEDYASDLASSNVPTYDSFAVTLWSNLYSKIGDKIGINISAENMGFIDGFWNWLLSGPAEMTKVDNQYYEWSVNQDGTVSSIPVIQNPYAFIGNYQLYPLPVTRVLDNTTSVLNSPSDNIYGIFSVVNNVEWFIGISLTNSQFQYRLDSGNYSYSELAKGWQFVRFQAGTGGHFVGAHVTYSGSDTRPYAYFGSYDATAISTASDDISILPYVGDVAPQDVYIPDNTDVNYAPQDVVIPLDIPWDNSLFGDGVGTLTDAQSTSISGVVDNSIVDSADGTLTLADTENPSIPSPSEVYIPLLPVTLPNFNFSFSGIWHYVVSWVQSLGSWFSMVFTVWSNLPYAIVLPVYATAVVVIIIGTLKRFL